MMILFYDRSSLHVSVPSCHGIGYNHTQHLTSPPQPVRPVLPGRNSLKLWQFLQLLLDDPNNQGCIRWLEREKGKQNFQYNVIMLSRRIRASKSQL